MQQPFKPRPTIVENPVFDRDAVSERLNRAMKGKGADEDAIIESIIRFSNKQRQKVRRTYFSAYAEDLLNRVKSETKGNLSELLIGLLTPTARYDAEWLHKAMKGLGTKEDILVEILVGKSNQQIVDLRDEFQKLTDQSLDDALRKELSGFFLDIMLSLASGAREMTPGDPVKAKKDAEKLWKAGKGQWGTEESKFRKILCRRSFAHLRLVFLAYSDMGGEDIADSIKKEFSGDTKTALLAVAKVVRSPSEYFSERLNEAMKGFGTNNQKLNRILVTRSEIDLGDIKSTYFAMYGKSLAEHIKKETSGNYEKALLQILGEGPK